LFLLRKLQEKYPFPALVWYIIVETALVRIAFFMTMPFVALRMSDTSGTSATWIGAVIGLGPLVATIIGFYIGHLSDLWGRRRIIFLAMMALAVTFFGFSMASTPLEFAFLMGLSGLSRGGFGPVSTALLSDLCSQEDESGKLQESAFHLRYYAINIGAAIGPLIGATFLHYRPTLGFQIASLVYLVSAFLFLFFSNRWGLKQSEQSKKRPTHSIREVMKVLTSDRVLLLYLMAFFCTSVAYSQIDTTLTLYLKERFGAKGVTLFAGLLSCNGLIVVLFTLPLLSWTKRFNINKSCAISSVVWGVGFIGMGLAIVPYHFFIAMVVVTLGEIVVFANGYLVIEALAPEDMKGAYLGTTNLGQVGVVVGPMIGGALLESGSGSLVFYSMGGLMCCTGILYFLAYKGSQKRLAEAAQEAKE